MSASPSAEERRHIFTHDIVVEDAHLDRFGHANNVVVVQWLQDVAEAHSASVGFPIQAYERLGAGFVVRRHEVDYLRPSNLGERLRLRTWIETARNVSCDRGTEILSLDHGHLIAKATTLWVFADLAAPRPIRIPDAVRLAFGYAARRSSDSTPPSA